MKNWIKYIITPTYKVTYKPIKSQQAKVYKVIGNPTNAMRVSKEGHKFFTLPVLGQKQEFQSFRCDGVSKVGFAII